MGITELTEWIKWLLIIIVSAVMAWERLKRWYYRRNGKDRRSPNPSIETKVSNLCRDFKNHEKNDKERTQEMKDEFHELRKEQVQQGVSIGKLEGRMNSR